MIKIKTALEIDLMRHAGKINARTHKLLAESIKAGVTTNKLNQIAEDYIISQQAIPSFKNHEGFPKSICASINEQVVHGIPSDYVLKDGDLVKIDVGVNYNGYHSDCAYTYIVGKVSAEVEELVNNTQAALTEGIKAIKPGAYLHDISNRIADYATKHKLGIVTDLVGHGIGKDLHEDPNIPNFHMNTKGPKLMPGMTLAIEPMLNLGTGKVAAGQDGWTIITRDHQPSAHFEHTVLVTEDGYEILTGE